MFHTQKTLFLMGLVLGSRVSELFSLMRDCNSLKRLADGSFRIYQDPHFMVENEDPFHRSGLVTIQPLQDGSDALCPAKALSEYLILTEKTKSSHLFVHLISLGKWNMSSMRLAIVRLIQSAQPHSFPRCHDLRKMATSLAFYSNMSVSDINKKVGWKSHSVFSRHYLCKVLELHHTCSALQ